MKLQDKFKIKLKKKDCNTNSYKDKDSLKKPLNENHKLCKLSNIKINNIHSRMICYKLKKKREH